MRFRIIFITIIFSFFTQFLDAKDSRYVNREYVLKGFAYSSNEDTIDRVYPGDKIEVLYIEENFAPTNKQEQYWAKVKLSNGKEGFIPEAFLQNKKPKIKGMIHRALFRAPEYFVTVSVLNARSKPSLNGAILFALNRGDVVQVLQFSEKDELIGGISAKWAYVQKGTDKAWVFSGYLSLKKEETVEEKKDTDYNPKEGETKYIRLSELDLYEFPTTFSDKKGKLKENTAVKIEKINHRKETLEGIQSYWVKVRAEKGGQDGWVFAGYLKNKTEEKKPEPTKEEKEEKEEKKTTFSLPLKKGDFNISSSYGPRKIFGKNGFHNGLDMY
ncbi:MAG: SH3 domain-containing protein, partial [Leptospiraceae bacterium]|nr:SH3 domain-containing protein [Leptospiraceae bacterium]